MTSPNYKVQCSACEKDITHHVKALCPQVLCVPCFAQLDPLPSSYQVASKMNFEVFESGWTA